MTLQTEEKEKEQSKEKVTVKKKITARSVFKEIFSTALTFLIALGVCKFTFRYLIQKSVVDGCSMVPTLHENDRLLSTKILIDPKPEDIIIIRSEKLNKDIVKRVIALEGQTVDIDFEKGFVYVDGKKLNEQLYNEGEELTSDYFINTMTTRDMGAFDTYPIVVPENYVFVLGDNRNVSLDSKSNQLGFVPKDEIIGKVFMRTNPLTDIKFF